MQNKYKRGSTWDALPPLSWGQPFNSEGERGLFLCLYKVKEEVTTIILNFFKKKINCTWDARGENPVSYDHGSAKHGGKQQKVLWIAAIF